jgi:hypothetical protein
VTAGNGSILSMRAQIGSASDRRYPDRPDNGERALGITAQAAIAVVVIGHRSSRAKARALLDGERHAITECAAPLWRPKNLTSAVNLGSVGTRHLAEARVIPPSERPVPRVRDWLTSDNCHYMESQ